MSKRSYSLGLASQIRGHGWVRHDGIQPYARLGQPIIAEPARLRYTHIGQRWGREKVVARGCVLFKKAECLPEAIGQHLLRAGRLAHGRVLSAPKTGHVLWEAKHGEWSM